MSIVYKVETLAGGRRLVTLEDGRCFPLGQEEIEQYEVQEGRALSPQHELRIFGEVLPGKAKLCAMNYLLHMDRTERQLRRKLGELFFPEEITEQAVAYVKGFRYIDDVRYAAHYIECRKSAKSLYRIEQELYQKGVSREDVQEALQQADTPDEERQIRELLEKKHYHAGAERAETDRVIRFLLRRGYQMSAIRRALETLSCEVPEEE